MKNTLFKTLILAFAVMLFVTGFGLDAFAQTAPTRTTLSTAMPAGARSMVVASATGFTASTNTAQYFVLIENDYRQVLTVSGTAIGLGPSKAAGVGHVSGATVIFGITGNWLTGTTGSASGSTGVFPPSVATGSCARANQQYLPMFVPNLLNNLGTLDCLGGNWTLGTLPDSPGQLALIKACTVPIGSVAYGSFGTSTTASTTGQLMANLFVPYTMWATGITQLNGSAVDGASKKIVILYDELGNLLANSATAGTTATGNDAFQAIPFTAAQFIVGPANYFIGLQDDTADVNGLRTVAVSTFNNVLGSSITSVFGTVAAVTPPTTFTQDTAPIACAY